MPIVPPKPWPKGRTLIATGIEPKPPKPVMTKEQREKRLVQIRAERRAFYESLPPGMTVSLSDIRKDHPDLFEPEPTKQGHTGEGGAEMEINSQGSPDRVEIGTRWFIRLWVGLVVLLNLVAIIGIYVGSSGPVEAWATISRTWSPFNLVNVALEIVLLLPAILASMWLGRRRKGN